MSNQPSNVYFSQVFFANGFGASIACNQDQWPSADPARGEFAVYLLRGNAESYEVDHLHHDLADGTSVGTFESVDPTELSLALDCIKKIPAGSVGFDLIERFC